MGKNKMKERMMRERNDLWKNETMNGQFLRATNKISVVRKDEDKRTNYQEFLYRLCRLY